MIQQRPVMTGKRRGENMTNYYKYINNALLTVGMSSPSAYAQSLTCKAVTLLGTAGKFYRSDEI
jgi:hypothetical protein